MDRYAGSLNDKNAYTSISNWQLFVNKRKAELEQNHPGEDPAKFNIKLEHLIFPNDVDFTGTYEFSLSFSDCLFEGNIFFYNVTFHRDLSLAQCRCEGELYIRETAAFERDFDIIELNVKKQVYVRGGTFDLCRWSINHSGTLKIAGGSFKELNIGYWGACDLAMLSISLSPKMSGLIRITNPRTKIIFFSIFKYTAEVSISIEDISVNLLSIYRYRNDRNFRITNLQPINDSGIEPSEISITESYLGKAEFYNIDFSRFEVINIHNSHISDASFVSVLWKDNITSFKGRSVHLSEDEILLAEKISGFESSRNKKQYRKDADIVRYLHVNREAYRQLKYIYSKQGDVVKEQWFHSKEMNVYERTLGFEKDFWTKLTLRFSYTFSNFGQSISKPLAALFVGHSILFFLLLIAGGIDTLQFTPFSPTLAGLETGSEKFFQYINPLRKYDADFKGYHVLIDLVMRIWSSFMLYNIIRASRRFIK